MPTAKCVLRRPASSLLKPSAHKKSPIPAPVNLSAQHKPVRWPRPPKKHQLKKADARQSKKVGVQSAPSTPVKAVRKAMAQATPAPSTPRPHAQAEPSTSPKKTGPAGTRSPPTAFSKKFGRASIFAPCSKTAVRPLHRVCQSALKTKAVGKATLRIEPASIKERKLLNLVSQKSTKEGKRMGLAPAKKAKSKFAKRAQDMVAKRAQERMAKVVRDAVDPTFLRNKYEHMIPKKPASPYHLFIADDAKQKQARELLKESLKDSGWTEVANVNQQARLADMWRSLPAVEKAPYEQKYAMAQTLFEQANKVWQRTEVFKKIDLLERQQKEAKMCAKRAKKEAEEKEIEELLDGSVQAQPGRGLQQGRTAIISGVGLRWSAVGPPVPQSLNGREVTLVQFLKASDRWIVMPIATDTATPAWPSDVPLHMQPGHLIWSALVKQAKKTDQRQKEEASKRQQREAERAAREEKRQQEETAKKQQRDVEKIAKAEESEARRVLRESELQAVRDVHKAFQEAAKEQRRNAKSAARAVKENQEGLQRSIKEATKAAIRAWESKPPQQSASEVPVEMAEAEFLD